MTLPRIANPPPRFPGAAAHRGYPHFFKTDCVHKIYGDKPGNFQTQLTACAGVKQGCADSLASYNGGLYYVSVNGVEYFESLPENRSRALGLERPGESPRTVPSSFRGDLRPRGGKGSPTQGSQEEYRGPGVWSI